MNNAAIGAGSREKLNLSRIPPRSTLSATIACYAIVFWGSNGCGGGSNSNEPVSPALTAITVSPTYSSIELGNNLQFHAQGSYSNGSTKDLSTSVEWSSSNEHMASIGTLGLATASATGGVTIKATSNGVSGSTMLAITPNVSAQLVWFTPDDASADMLTLFSHPEEWPNARTSVQVLRIRRRPAPNCTKCMWNMRTEHRAKPSGRWGIFQTEPMGTGHRDQRACREGVGMHG